MPEAIPPSPMEPPPIYEAIHFNWGVLIRPRLPSHIPFQITIQVCGQDLPQTLIDEGASVSILSSFAWQDLGFLQLVLVTQNLLASNRRTSQPLGTFPQFQDPLDFALLLGRDCVYAMKYIVSTLFRVISFPQDG
jgi:hypothetical protein